MSTYLKVTTQGADEMKAKFQGVPPHLKPLAFVELTKYFLGNDQRGMKHYPNYQSPTYVRTYRLKNSWYVGPITGSSTYIANDTTYAGYPMGDPPARHMQKIGWKGALERVHSNMTGALAAVQRVIDAWAKGYFS